MPAQVASNLQILAGLQSQMQTEEDSLNTAKQQRVYLETLVNQYRSLQGSTKSERRGKVGVAGGRPGTGQAQGTTGRSKSRYTDRHPDVRKVKEQIAETEKMKTRLSLI